MGQLVEVIAVAVEEISPELLVGASVDTPTAGRRLSAHAIEIGGWALGRADAVVTIEARHDERVLAQAAVGNSRADIADAYPDIEGAGTAGFELEVDAAGLPAESKVVVHIVVGSETVPVARLLLRRYWRGEWFQHQPLLTIVVTRDDAEQNLEETIRSLERERYPLTELVVLDPANEGSAATLRNEAIRLSEGTLILFLAAGMTLAAGGIAKGIGRLETAAEACALIDAEQGDNPGVALYRRSAFEELDGFAECAAECDGELASRAGQLDALFEPGVCAAAGTEVQTIVVAGALAAKPGNGGEAWVRLSWVLGLRKLGFDAWLLEEVSPAAGDDGREFFAATADRHGLADRAQLIEPGGTYGPLQRPDLGDLAAGAVALVNISGNLRDPDLLAAFRRRGYVDLDPGFTQLWQAEGQLGDQLERHDTHFTVGLNLGQADCSVPSGGLSWIPLPPPVLLEEWMPPTQPGFDRFTTVGTWRNQLGTLEACGETYTLKHHQLRRFAAVPRGTSLPFEIALAIHPDENAEVAKLEECGWKVIEAATVAADTDAFRDYIRGSGAEFSVAQGVYAEARTGWISDRTAHYLAAGRPAAVQETGIPEPLRPEAGMLTFSDPAEAIAETEEIFASYTHHSRAARAYATRTFDSDRVLTKMLEAIL